MKEYEYNDGLKPGNRRPHLVLVSDVTGDVREFYGQAIPGMCVVLSQHYKKDGKWSATTFQLALADGVRPIYLLAKLHQTFGDECKGWTDLSAEIGLTVEQAKAVIGKIYPRAAARLDDVESALQSLAR